MLITFCCADVCAGQRVREVAMLHVLRGAQSCGTAREEGGLGQETQRAFPE